MPRRVRGFFCKGGFMKQLQTDSYLNVGKIVNTQGIRGEVRVIATTDFGEERFQPGNELLLFPKGQYTPETVTIERHRRHKNFDILKFVGLDNINDVEKYRDAQLKVTRDNLVDLEEDEFYYFQIIGCKVMDENCGELGVVTEILTPGANDVWVVQSKEHGEILIPYIESVVLEVNVNDKVIKTDLPEGLID